MNQCFQGRPESVEIFQSGPRNRVSGPAGNSAGGKSKHFSLPYKNEFGETNTTLISQNFMLNLPVKSKINFDQVLTSKIQSGGIRPFPGVP